MKSTGLLLMCAILASGCDSDETARTGIPDAAPSITGTITSVDLPSFLVEERPEESSGSAKAYVRLTPESTVLYDDGSTMPAADLRRGQRSRVWFSGPVAESYPVQAQAETVVVDRSARPAATAGSVED